MSRRLSSKAHVEQWLLDLVVTLNSLYAECNGDFAAQGGPPTLSQRLCLEKAAASRKHSQWPEIRHPAVDDQTLSSTLLPHSEGSNSLRYSIRPQSASNLQKSEHGALKPEASFKALASLWETTFEKSRSVNFSALPSKIFSSHAGSDPLGGARFSGSPA